MTNILQATRLRMTVIEDGTEGNITEMQSEQLQGSVH